MVGWSHEISTLEEKFRISARPRNILSLMNVKYWNFYVLHGIRYGNFVIANVKY